MAIAVMSCALHEDAFYEFFVPYRHPLSNHDIWGGLGLETYGDDLKVVQSLDENHVWTVVDGDRGRDAWILPGYHYVNRICYLTSRRPHYWIPAEFRVPSPPTSLTEIGLKRQLTKIQVLLRAMTSR